MSIPKYNEFMPSIIRCLGDGKIHSSKEIIDFCIDEFKLDEYDKSETISSGQSKLVNRIEWAKVYLKKAELIESPQRAHFKITKSGK